MTSGPKGRIAKLEADSPTSELTPESDDWTALMVMLESFRGRERWRQEYVIRDVALAPSCATRAPVETIATEVRRIMGVPD